MEKTVISVAQYIDTINNVLRTIDSSALAIEGEVSDYRVAQGKWVSFDLKDEEQQAVLKCFMTVWQLQYPLEDGMKIRVTGYPKVYERFGQFKLNVQAVELVGEGALRRAYELLKKKLQDEGLFDPSRKRSLKRFPERIGLITSRDAAAYGDFLRILNNRWGGVDIQHTHVHVQGKQAVGEIVGAFRFFNSLPETDRPDVIVMTRGGGGLEDLHAFNDEAVARAVFQSSVPVVCAVGHERDESLSDYVADIRASTPSNAAERVVPNREEVLYEIHNMTHYAGDKLHDALLEKGRVIERTTRTISFVLEREKARCERLFSDLLSGVDVWIPRLRDRLSQSERLLKNLDPKQVLSRGYAIVSAGGKAVRSAKTLDIGAEIAVQLAAGQVDAEVLRVDGKGKQKLV